MACAALATVSRLPLLLQVVNFEASTLRVSCVCDEEPEAAGSVMGPRLHAWSVRCWCSIDAAEHFLPSAKARGETIYNFMLLSTSMHSSSFIRPVRSLQYGMRAPAQDGANTPIFHISVIPYIARSSPDPATRRSTPRDDACSASWPGAQPT